MLAEYKDYVYIANVKDEQVTLLTYNQSKMLEGFEPKRDYFKKVVDINDSCVSAIYDIHFYVKFRDTVEDTDIWMVDEDRAVGLKGNIENNEVIIDIAHDAKDDSWIQYEKGAAAKKINLYDCEEYIVEKKYIKRNEKIVDKIIEKSSVTLKVFRNSIVMNRRSNL